jgi:hypothetical protein
MPAPDYTDDMQTPALLVSRQPTDTTRIRRTLALTAMAGWQGTTSDLQTLLHAVAAARLDGNAAPAISRAAAALAGCRMMRSHDYGLDRDALNDVDAVLRLLDARGQGRSLQAP